MAIQLLGSSIIFQEADDQDELEECPDARVISSPSAPPAAISLVCCRDYVLLPLQATTKQTVQSLRFALYIEVVITAPWQAGHSVRSSVLGESDLLADPRVKHFFHKREVLRIRDLLLVAAYTSTHISKTSEEVVASLGDLNPAQTNSAFHQRYIIHENCLTRCSQCIKLPDHRARCSRLQLPILQERSGFTTTASKRASC